MSDRQIEIQSGFNSSTGFLDIGELFKKGADAVKAGIKAYADFITPEVERVIDEIANKEGGPLEEDIERVANLVKEQGRGSEGSGFMAEEEREVVSDNRPSFVEDEGENLMAPDQQVAAGAPEPVNREEGATEATPEDKARGPQDQIKWLEDATTVMSEDVRKNKISPQSKKFMAETMSEYGIEDQGSEKANLAKALEVAEEKKARLRFLD